MEMAVHDDDTEDSNDDSYLWFIAKIKVMMTGGKR